MYVRMYIRRYIAIEVHTGVAVHVYIGYRWELAAVDRWLPYTVTTIDRFYCT